MTGILDLFCGASGFGLGAQLAGFQVEVAVDADEQVTASHLANFPGCSLKIRDLSTASAADLVAGSRLEGSRITGIIGGPPCQGFSHMGKRLATDPRNDLVGAFFRIVAEANPKFFVLENVPGILSGQYRGFLESHLEALSGKYKFVGPIKLNAADFGAPTNRQRVIVIGYDPTVIDPITEKDLIAAQQPRITVDDALADLPSPNASICGIEDLFWAAYADGGAPSAYGNRMRQAPPIGLGDDLARAASRAGLVSGFKPTAHTAVVVERYAALAPGDQDGPSKARRLKLDGLCVTLRAGTASDKGSFQALRPIHPTEHRMITVREAARLQGFPDWFRFHSTIWHSFRMIGNSVSPIFAESILAVVASKIRVNLERAA